MTTETTIAERATVPQILADLILLGQRAGLPDPIEMLAYDNGILSMELSTFDALRAWIGALGSEDIHSQPFQGNSILHTSRGMIERRGWSIQLSATPPADAAEPLDEETVAGLEAVAEPERVSDDRVGEILAGLNSFVVFELEPYTEIIDGVSVLKREIVGADYNLDKAVDWAIDLPEVSSTGGPDRGKASVELVDGTVLEFVPAEKSWSVTVSDDAAVSA